MYKASLNTADRYTEHTQNTHYPTVDSVIKALGILDCFNRREVELSLKELCTKTGLYKSRVHRLCATLIESGYLVRTSWTTYQLGPKLLNLGKIYEQANSLKSVASVYMRELSRKTSESTALFILNKSKCICIAREVSEARLIFAINEGDELDLHPTAAGRVLLAHSSSEFIDRTLSDTPEGKSLEHMVDIKKELKFIRQKGYGFNEEELESGISSIAAPVFNYEDKAIAALAIVGPSHRFQGKEKKLLIKNLLEATEQISELV